ncbi:hypothetical protein Pmani_009460 [Petrolisthes manimaculis]|uniref:Dynamin-binding protein n=1 Tax=Petrolisthes manimaculis TaxID=1843537 RepID=A0AAE1Q476_9EUCA|nr:hypothetical protein Pmani_009460 [Petrolisthes manimaculis]
MKAGDVCRCISDFSGISAEELTIYKNDLVQIISIVDRHWVEAEGGGGVGKVPSSVLVPSPPPHVPAHHTLFVAYAEFMPSQPGDLGLVRGDYVIGLNEIDESWWCGEANGKKGIFPRNFVWPINKDIMQIENTSERPVKMRAKVNMSIRAQLPDELDLYAGDIVNITHIIDKDWYRGESNGAMGIFPSTFVDLLEGEEDNVMSHDSGDHTTTHNHPSEVNGTGTTNCPTPVNGSAHNSSSVNGTLHYPAPVNGMTGQCSNLADDASFTLPALHSTPSMGVGYGTDNQSRTTGNPSQALADSPRTPSSSLVSPLTPLTPSSSSAPSPLGTRQSVDDSSLSLSNISSHWKTLDTGDEDDLFDDDYFKQNMPGLYTARKSDKSSDSPTSLHTARGSAKTTDSPTGSYSSHPGNTMSTSATITATSTSHSSMPNKHSAYSSSSSPPSRKSSSVFRYENISDFMTTKDASPRVNDTHGTSLQRYENIPESGVTVGVMSQSGGGCILGDQGTAASTTTAHTHHNVQPSAFSNVQQEETATTSNNQVLKSLSQRVDEYFSHQTSSLGSKHTTKSSSSIQTPPHHRSSLTPQDYHNLPSSPGYNENNTGIEPYSRAIFSFRAQYPNELTFKKGDIIHLIRHIDSHWTLGKVGDNMGIFPTSYVDVIVDCLHDQEEVFLARPEARGQAEAVVGSFAPRREPYSSLMFSEPIRHHTSATSFSTHHHPNTASSVTPHPNSTSSLPKHHTTTTPSIPTSTTSIYLGHAKTLYDFQGVQRGDVCMTRGDILKILKHVDANWTIVKNLTSGSEGMCPKNYIQLIAESFQDSQTKEISKELNAKERVKNEYSKEIFKGFHGKECQTEEGSKRSHARERFKGSHSRESSRGSLISESPPRDSSAQLVDIGTSSDRVASERKPRLLVQSSLHERSRSSSPFGSSGKRRSYNKGDFGSIRKQEVEPVLAKNMALFDATIKGNTITGVEKKSGESVFVERELESMKSGMSTGSEKKASESVFAERGRDASSTFSGNTLLPVDWTAKPKRPVSDPLLHFSVESASREASEDINSTSSPLSSQLKTEAAAHVLKPKIQAPKPGITAKPELRQSLKLEADIMKPEIVSTKPEIIPTRPEITQAKPGILALKLERPVAAPRTTTAKPSIPPRMRLTKRASCSSLTTSSSDSKGSSSSASMSSGGGGGSLPASPPVAHSRRTPTSLLAGAPVSLSQLNNTQIPQLNNAQNSQPNTQISHLSTTEVPQQNNTQSSRLSTQTSLLDDSQMTLLADTTDILTPMPSVSTSSIPLVITPSPPVSSTIPPVSATLQPVLTPTPAVTSPVNIPAHPPSESTYACIRKPPPDSNNKQSSTLPRGDSVGSGASFPEDVSHISSEGPYASGETNLSTTSSGLVPQRPAPPPPPKLSHQYSEPNQDYYSIPAQDTPQYANVEEAEEGQVLEVADDTTPNDTTPKDTPTTATVTTMKGDTADTQTPSTTRFSVRKQYPHRRDTIIRRSAGKNQRRELVREIVTTEHEYIHDLEALIQVVKMSPEQKREGSVVDVDALMGNIYQVVEVAKLLVKELDKVAFRENDKEVRVGAAFLLCAHQLCQVYKVYCSTHNVVTEPLLKKYEEEPETNTFLQWVLSELQQHKIQLLDMRSVLIKPVQRILKYPLFLDRLVSETDPKHPDHRDLTKANTKMADVAKEINEYTKRLGLVNKYRFESDQSLQSKMQRLSLHSVVKKSTRISTQFSEMLGIMSQTKDPEFDEEVCKFRSLQKFVAVIGQDTEALVLSVRARHSAELEMARGLAEIFQEGACKAELEALQRTVVESCNRHFDSFENFVKQRVVMPAKQLVTLCEVPERLILKRHDKRLDYDNAQYKLDRNRDPAKTRVLEEELSHTKGTYEALHTQLMTDLPVLTRAGTEVMVMCTKSLLAARMYLQGRLAMSYLNLAQVPGLSYSGSGIEDMLAQFRIKYLQQLGEFRQLTFIPADSLQRSVIRTSTRAQRTRRNTLDPGARKESQEQPQPAPQPTTKRKVVGVYPSCVLYVATEVHTPSEVMDLTLYPGDHVALLKNKDPLGNSDRWFVDDGDNKGFVRSTSLKPLQTPDQRTGIQTALPSATSSTVPLPNPTPIPYVSRVSTVPPRTAPPPPLPERPPRYEDLFPQDSTSLRIGVSPMTMNPLMQVPPPQYTPGQSPVPQPPACPLPSKPGHHYSPVEEVADYYTPPLDRRQSDDYSVPVSEEHNIYEEIDQNGSQTKEIPTYDNNSEASGGGRDTNPTSPIYEVIHDCDPPQPIHQSAVGGQEEESQLQPQFYYAQYNFGGSDTTQLNLVAGQVVLVVFAESHEWWFVEDRHGHQGYVPASYLTPYT